MEKRRKIFAIPVQDVLLLLQSVGAVPADSKLVDVQYDGVGVHSWLRFKTEGSSFGVVPEGDIIPTEDVVLSRASGRVDWTPMGSPYKQSILAINEQWTEKDPAVETRYTIGMTGELPANPQPDHVAEAP